MVEDKSRKMCEFQLAEKVKLDTDETIIVLRNTKLSHLSVFKQVKDKVEKLRKSRADLSSQQNSMLEDMVLMVSSRNGGEKRRRFQVQETEIKELKREIEASEGLNKARTQEEEGLKAQLIELGKEEEALMRERDYAKPDTSLEENRLMAKMLRAASCVKLLPNKPNEPRVYSGYITEKTRTEKFEFSRDKHSAFYITNELWKSMGVDQDKLD